MSPAVTLPPDSHTGPAVPTPPGETSPFAIETRSLGHRYGRHWAVRHLDLQVPRGSVFGFLGLNGAGKSTTIRMLLGVLPPHEGTARVLGLDPAREDVLLKRRVGYVPDTPSFYEWMTVEETLAFVAHYRRPEWDDARARQLTGLFEVPLSQKVGALSRGQRAKVALICALAFHPDLLLLDEPTLGLDPVARRQFLEGLLSEYMDGDRTVLISSHLIHEIAGIVDHVAILSTGHLLRTQRTEDLLAQLKRVRLVYENTPPPSSAFRLDGLLRAEQQGREALLVIDRFEPSRHSSDLSSLGAATWTVEDLSLEEAFVELAGRGESR